MVVSMGDFSNQVSQELMADPRTKDYCAKIDVAADRGIITLSGTVPSTQVSDAAEEVARKMPGVITVHNELKVTGR